MSRPTAEEREERVVHIIENWMEAGANLRWGACGTVAPEIREAEREAVMAFAEWLVEKDYLVAEEECYTCSGVPPQHAYGCHNCGGTGAAVRSVASLLAEYEESQRG